MRFLVFTLYGPMVSFGEIAVGERRSSWDRPARSAVLGLVAAAMGYERADGDMHQALENALHFGVLTEAPGRPLMDYHTAQAPKARRGQAFATRRDELQAQDLSTVLSSREWRTDAYFTVALWERRGQQFDLELVARCLREPRFVLYIGRKSAPLGLPLNPAIVEATTFLEAFNARSPTPPESEVLDRIQGVADSAKQVACDLDAPGVPIDHRLERRRDTATNRERWQFADRTEAVFEWIGDTA